MMPSFSFYPRSSEFLPFIQSLGTYPSREIEEEAMEAAMEWDSSISREDLLV